MSTIYALSTVLGKSGVAVIRITGPRAKDVLHDLTGKECEPRKAKVCSLHSPFTGEVLDRIIAIFFKAPNTFTGEDIVEFHLHGSIAVIKDVLKTLSEMPYIRYAEPGEFTRVAFANGKMDLVEVEALADLIHSETTAQRRAAIHQISGHLTALYKSWKDSLVEIMAQFEAYIDFPEDDIPYSAINLAMLVINDLIQDIQQHLALSEQASIMTRGFSIAIAGPPNVGKSSIMNLLSKQEIAIVSDVAGTTRDLLQVKMEINGVGVTIYDTAGIRADAADAIEEEGIRRARAAIANADIKIYVFDVQHLQERNNFVIEDDAIVLLNKCDLIQGQLTSSPNELLFSVKNLYNLTTLFNRISDLIENKCSISSDTLITTQPRQKEKLLEVLSYLNSIDLLQPLEITAQKIRLAALAIEYITGKITLDDVLDKIFSTFCIGK